ncbi:MAG: ribosomal RNA small subunit methyltransferase A [Candidatus Omnitrophica bacterium]|nr:ribosomal RNA small subunit methyltransferase A [Candidatus Omnitrophota bacterium]
MDLKELRQIWREHRFDPKRSLGQNFLIDNNVKEKILNSLSLVENSTVIEIGPGFGIMTFELAGMCGRLIAVEKDSKICDIMKELFDEKDNIAVINADVLETDLCALAGKAGKVTVYGNIPYYISTPIVQKLIESRICVGNAYLVTQEELANRMVASPGSKEYGSLSCFVQFYARCKKLFRINKNCFFPRPKVNSSLLSFTMLEEPSVRVNDSVLMFRIIRKAFSQRRKKAVNSLSSGPFLPVERSTWQEAFVSCGIDPASRAEVISLEDYARLSDLVGTLL